ncbi:MAG: choice-of-anchor X domain-containing protein, partial [Myxococcota bacterium]
TDCVDLESTGVSLGVESVELVVDPAEIVADGAESIVVQATVNPVCAGVSPGAVRLTLSIGSPSTELRSLAFDDGLGADASAGDGVYSAILTNLFGPSVAGQSVVVQAVVVLDREEVEGIESITLRGAP